MRKLILWMMVSLDGFFEGPNRELDWHVVDEELHTFDNDELRQMGAFLSGRQTHQLMADFWPTADADPSQPPYIAEFSRIWKAMPKIVFSRTLERADWNTTVVRDNVAEEVTRLKQQPGSDLVLSGADIAATLMRLGLVDEYRLFVAPVILGNGNPLFRESDEAIRLRLVEARPFGSGVVMLRYAREVEK
jgi:dihydrofolate reductase